MSAVDSGVVPGLVNSEVGSEVDERTLRILEQRRRTAVVRRRGWLIRRMLLLADMLGLTIAFAVAQLLFGLTTDTWIEVVVFALSLPAWVMLAKLYSLYERDEERTEHSTIDEIVGVLHFAITGTVVALATVWAAGFAEIELGKFLTFFLLALGLIVLGRSIARSTCHRHISYLQNTLIVGAGEVGQLVARKFLQHPEYGINLVGFVDAEPRERRSDLEHLTLLGPPDRLPSLVRLFDVERVIVAFSNDAHEQTLELIRSLKDLHVQVDIVPRLFELLGPSVGIHTVEGLPLIGLPPVKLSRSSRMIKRTLDIVGASVGLVVTAPVFLVVAIAIRRDADGPVFFRQTRLGQGMREFRMLKFRTMKTGTSADEHREYIKSLMSSEAAQGSNGLFKLSRDEAITGVGRWLRRTSLDELPQLLNVLRGDMSLVGPRPCIPYEMENFEPHHFERFLVPAGLTGLWQVTGRAHMTFREALDLDVAYARGWSLGLDLTLMLRTARHLMRRGATA